MLRDLVTTIQETGNKKVPAISVAQHDARPLVRRNQADSIASLLVRHRRCFPCLNSRRRLGHLRRGAALGNGRIVSGPATRSSLRTTWPTPTTAVVDVVDRTVEAVHPQPVAVAVRDRT